MSSRTRESHSWPRNESTDKSEAVGLRELTEAEIGITVGGTASQAEKRLSDHRNEMRRNWAS